MDSLNSVAAIVGIISGVVTIISTAIAAIARSQENAKQAKSQRFNQPNYPLPKNQPPPYVPPPTLSPGYPRPPVSYAYPQYPPKRSSIAYPGIALSGTLSLVVYFLGLIIGLLILPDNSISNLSSNNIIFYIAAFASLIIGLIAFIFALIQAGHLNKIGWIIGISLGILIFPGLGATLFGIFGPRSSR